MEEPRTYKTGPRYLLWQPRFFDRALRTVQEYNEKVEYIHLNPVRAGLVCRLEDWRWSSCNECAGISAEEQKKHCGLIFDRVSMPSDPRARSGEVPALPSNRRRPHRRRFTDVPIRELLESAAAGRRP